MDIKIIAGDRLVNTIDYINELNEEIQKLKDIIGRYDTRIDELKEQNEYYRVHIEVLQDKAKTLERIVDEQNDNIDMEMSEKMKRIFPDVDLYVVIASIHREKCELLMKIGRLEKKIRNLEDKREKKNEQ